MSEWVEAAEKRLDDESKNGMKGAVKDALKEFARQDDEFAQAIAQGGSFTDCMAAVAKRIKSGSISDLDAYSAAAEFYFPGSKVKFQMRIELSEHEEKTDDLLIDLSAFL